MVSQVTYDINTIDGPQHITITPVNELVAGDIFYATGVYKLSDGVVGMGEVVFDEQMEQWEYNGIDALTLEEAEEIANFIKDYENPANTDPAAL